jgi:hypothetical protein
VNSICPTLESPLGAGTSVPVAQYAAATPGLSQLAHGPDSKLRPAGWRSIVPGSGPAFAPAEPQAAREACESDQGEHTSSARHRSVIHARLRRHKRRYAFKSGSQPGRYRVIRDPPNLA